MTLRATLEDVGVRAGVSAKTVSNVLLGRPNVSEATRARVRAAVAETGYVANEAGRGLASGRTGRIALVVPNLHQPYFAEMAERLMGSSPPTGSPPRSSSPATEAMSGASSSARPPRGSTA